MDTSNASFSDPNTTLAKTYIILILTVIFLFWRRRRFYKLSRLFPGPLELPIIGIFFHVYKPSLLLLKLKMVLEIYKTETIFTYFGPQPTLYTVDPNLFQKVFTSSKLYNKPNILYEPLGYLFGDGLITSKSDKWRLHRKLIDPAFRKPILRNFLAEFNKNSKEFVKQLEQLDGKSADNLNEMLRKLMLTNGMETMLGLNYHEENDLKVDDNILKHYTRVMKSTIVMVFLNALKLSSFVKIFNVYKSRKFVFDFVDKLLKKRMLVLQNTNNNENKAPVDDIYLSYERNIFIDQIFKSYVRKRINWQDMLDESNSIMFGAFDTTATLQYFSLLFLAMHPEVEENVFYEIKTVFPEKNFNVSFEKLDNCVYLDMVIKETLRLAPSVPVVARGVVEDTQLTDDIMLPKDLIILINIFQAHRNENVWGANANTFNPDNFLPENIKQRHVYSYLPFAKGLRNCLGRNFAILATKVMLLHTIRNFRLTTDFKYEDLEYETTISLRLIKYPLLKIHKRG
ncbi:probable cytochrome P450 313a4 [Teleopsis dalmanni]|uniref:probable cytochrome P450 313a4 n=1 Tax=Teleopsis dalmanni TaxID=139649 RepID=UPI0018CE090C|nr:probable cytochrome P450 313a4 [Teleopsis dalmanni]